MVHETWQITPEQINILPMNALKNGAKVPIANKSINHYSFMDKT